MYLVVMPRVNLIVILLTYACYLYSINCPIVIYLPSMSLFILWRDTTSELWTPVQFPLHCYYCLLLLALFSFSHTIIDFHSIRSFLCLQQTGEIDNLIVSWEQSIYLWRVQVSRCCWCKAKHWTRCLEIVRSCREASRHHLLKFGFFLLVWETSVSYWGKTCYCAHHTFLLGFPTGWLSAHIKNFFWSRCRGKRRFLQGESRTHNLYFVFVLLYFIFSCIVLSKKQKN
jgi:hypothetical protein